MRNAFIFALVFCTMISATYGQSSVAPEIVVKAFEQKVMNAEDFEWEYEGEEKLWEVEYKKGKEEFESVFDENGNWVETEKEIKFSKLPESVKSTLKTDYSEYEVEEVEYVESPSGEYYSIEVELEKNGMELEYELVISPNGEVINKVEEIEEETYENDKD